MEVLGPELYKALKDPRNEKFWHDLLSKPNQRAITKIIIIDEDGLCHLKDK